MAQLAEPEALKNDSQLKQEIEFELMFRSMLAEYGVGLRQVIEIWDPIAAFGRALFDFEGNPQAPVDQVIQKTSQW